MCAVGSMAKTHMTNQSVHYLHEIISSLHAHHLTIGHLNHSICESVNASPLGPRTSTQKSIRVAAPCPWPQAASGTGQTSQQHTSAGPPAITLASNHKHPWTAALPWQPEQPPAASTGELQPGLRHTIEAHISPKKISVTNTSNNTSSQRPLSLPSWLA